MAIYMYESMLENYNNILKYATTKKENRKILFDRGISYFLFAVYGFIYFYNKKVIGFIDNYENLIIIIDYNQTNT